jgi:hypothetical protein
LVGTAKLDAARRKPALQVKVRRRGHAAFPRVSRFIGTGVGDPDAPRAATRISEPTKIDVEELKAAATDGEIASAQPAALSEHECSPETRHVTGGDRRCNRGIRGTLPDDPLVGHTRLTDRSEARTAGAEERRPSPASFVRRSSASYGPVQRMVQARRRAIDTLEATDHLPAHLRPGTNWSLSPPRRILATRKAAAPSTHRRTAQLEQPSGRW